MSVVMAYTSARRLPSPLGRTFTSGSKVDDAAKRRRRLVGLRRRERRCTFRCSTDCACEAATAFCPLTPIASLAVISEEDKTSSKPDCRAAHGAARIDRDLAENSFFHGVELEARSEYAADRTPIETK